MSVRWNDDAKRRLKQVPFFIRPFVRKRAETVAKQRGIDEVTSALLDDIKSKEHSG